MCIRQSFYPLTVLPVIFVYSKDLCICAVYKTYLLNEYLISPQVCIDIMEFCGEFISTCTQILDQTMFSLPQHKFKELISVCSLQWHYHTLSITDPMAKPKTMWTETFPKIYVYYSFKMIISTKMCYFHQPSADHFIFVKKLGIYMAGLRTVTLIHLWKYTLKSAHNVTHRQL